MASTDSAGERADRRLTEAISALGATGGLAVELPSSADPVRPGTGLRAARCLELFDAQVASRSLDEAARWLRGRGTGYYTIGSAGHESNGAVAAALKLTDPALLHYRSGAFYLVRAHQAGRGADGITDVLLGLVAASAEPIAGG